MFATVKVYVVAKMFLNKNPERLKRGTPQRPFIGFTMCHLQYKKDIHSDQMKSNVKYTSQMSALNIG